MPTPDARLAALEARCAERGPALKSLHKEVIDLNEEVVLLRIVATKLNGNLRMALFKINAVWAVAMIVLQGLTYWLIKKG